LTDGNGEFTDKMGLLVDKGAIGFGKRSWRYSMLVDNGTIKKMFIEPEVEGDPYTVSDADTMLGFIAPGAKAASDILLFTKPNCGHCARAKAALAEKGLAYDEVASSPRKLRAVSGKSTTPQVFIDGKHIGGADELVAYLKSTA
jgi:glutaredoxin-like protein